MSNETLQTVTEAEAPAATREIFADIKSTMGVALVNLVWRHLATEPSVLNWSWQALKPHYHNGAIPQAAWALRNSIASPPLAPLTERERNQIRTETGDPALLDAVLHTYERGNAQNLVAMCFLRCCIDTTDASQRGVECTSSSDEQATELADRVGTAIPPLPSLQSLSSNAQEQIRDMTSVWVPAHYGGITPSVFRHIAIWPGVLGLYRNRLCELPGDSLVAPIKNALAQANQEALYLPYNSAELPVLAEQDRQWLRRALDLFIDGMIGPGVVVVPAMRFVIKPLG